MALLKKIRSATLIESLIATVLIFIIFIVASLVVNNVLQNHFTKNNHVVLNRIYEVEYLINNKIIELPYDEEFENWNIKFSLKKHKEITLLNITAINRETKKSLEKNKVYEQ